MITLAPSANSVPPSTVSEATVRRIQITGDPQRTTSSTPVAAISPGSACHSALVGVLGHGQEAVTDRVAGGLVARDDQEDEERRDLGVSERLAVDVRVHQG